ncbi:MAG: hypothetical protein GWP61_01095 [Chloroflexi bacterium]|jgi:hypothetical protein|nr:hypothetical protein [Chloroflexota bacterium]
MNAVKVQYTVKAEYVETNKANIQRVMADLRKINNPDIKYSSFLLDDGKSFVHLVMRANDEAQKTLGELPSFQEFQRQLRESGPEVPPKAEDLALVGSSWDFF